MKITVPVPSLTALSRFVSDDECRYYLQGVCVQKHPTEGVLLIATDGHRMGVWHEPNAKIDGEVWPEQNIIVRLTKVDLQRINVKGDCCVPRHMHYVVIDTDEKTVTVGYTMQRLDKETKEYIETNVRLLTLYDMLIDATFPDWRKVVPTVTALEPYTISKQGFQAKFLSDFGYIIQPYGFVRMFKGSDDPYAPVLVTVENIPQFVGVLMPGGHLSNTDSLWDSVKTILQPPA